MKKIKIDVDIDVIDKNISISDSLGIMHFDIKCGELTNSMSDMKKTLEGLTSEKIIKMYCEEIESNIEINYLKNPTFIALTNDEVNEKFGITLRGDAPITFAFNKKEIEQFTDDKNIKGKALSEKIVCAAQATFDSKDQMIKFLENHNTSKKALFIYKMYENIFNEYKIRYFEDNDKNIIYDDEYVFM